MAGTPGGAPRPTGLGRLLNKTSDLGLALLVAGIVGMMILPLPTPLLDVLITFNLTISVILLLVAIYVSDALRIATFPTILLVATLFRLGLNVSSTRLILLQADAGRVIDAFGQFVVQGNYVVGAVVFLILLIIQFVVIARGSERVAEVAARFALDALPGKQMAIDADLRAGLLDQKEARARRKALQRESQFYGAMDGAMKFVKGDAIAGIVITLVNIAAGIAIGVGMNGMDLGQAMRVYGLLTIGDGLVSQIPALVISTAAGLVVTRVASEEEGTHLGEEIGAQILAHPRALAIAAGLLALLAAVPGLPTVPFLLLAGLCGAAAYGLHRSRKAREAREGAAADDGDGAHLEGPSPVSVVAGAGLAAIVDARRKGSELGPAVAAMREALHYELGIQVPPVRVRVDPSAPEEQGYAILLDDVPAARGHLRPEGVLCLAPEEQLPPLDVAVEPADHPVAHGASCWLEASGAEGARAAGFEVLSATDVLVRHLTATIRLNASHFVGVQEVQTLLDALERTHPALVRAVVPRVVGVPLLADVLRRLVDEGISIRHLRTILEALLEWGEHEKDPVALTELVRSSLRRYITFRYAGGEDSLPVYLLSPEIEEGVRSAVQRSSTGTYLALDPELGREIVGAVRTVVARPKTGRDAVVLTQPDVRRFVRKLIELDVPHAAVLSYQELEPRVVVQPLSRIKLAHEGGRPGG